jgi:predicted DNA-binding protein
MSLDKTIKVRLSDEHLKKANDDSSAIGKNTSEHIRDMIVDFEVVKQLKKE